MNTLTIFTISLVFIWSCLADDEEASTYSQESSHESSLTFYTCVACGGEEVITSYEKCRKLKSENTRKISEECAAKVLPKEVAEGDKRWEHYCQNPEDIVKVYKCFRDYYETLNEDDKASLEKFKECAERVNEEYCQDQSDDSTYLSDLN